MLEYFALAVLLVSITVLFYIFIFIHDLPHHIAKKRNHPQTEAIHYACWLSLFTLHALWPLVFLWSVSNRGPIEVAVKTTERADADELAALKSALAEATRRIESLEAKTKEGVH